MHYTNITSYIRTFVVIIVLLFNLTKRIKRSNTLVFSSRIRIVHDRNDRELNELQFIINITLFGQWL